MDRLATEKKVLKKLQIPDFRHLTKEKVISLASKSMMDKIDPEVAKKIIEQFPNFSDTMKDILHDCREWMDNIRQSNDDSIDSIYASCDSIISSLQSELEKDNLTFEEKKYIFDKMIEVVKMKSDKDSENKNFLLAMTAIGAVAVGAVTTALLSALGGAAGIEATDSDDSDGDTIT